MLVESQTFKMIKLGVCFIVLNVIGSSLAAPANDVSNLKIAQKPEGKPADLVGASNNKLQNLKGSIGTDRTMVLAAPVVQSDEKNKEQKVQSLIAVADAAIAELPQQKKPADDSAFKNNLQNLKGSDQDIMMSILPVGEKNNKQKEQSLTAVADAAIAELPQQKMKIHQIRDNVGETGDSQQNQLAPSNKAAQIDVMGAPMILQAKPQAISGENVPNPDEKKAINLKGRMPVNAENPTKLSVKSPAGNAKSDPKKPVDNTDAQPQAISGKNGQNSDVKKAVSIKAKLPEAKAEVSAQLAGSAPEAKAPKGKTVKSDQKSQVPAEKKPAGQADKSKQTQKDGGKPVAKADNTPKKPSKLKSKTSSKQVKA